VNLNIVPVFLLLEMGNPKFCCCNPPWFHWV